jgi:hypothetical protein
MPFKNWCYLLAKLNRNRRRHHLSAQAHQPSATQAEKAKQLRWKKILR